MPRIREYRWQRWAERQIERALNDRIWTDGVLAVDTETEGLAFADRPFCATFTYQLDTGDLVSGYIDLDPASDGWELRARLVRTLLSLYPVWVFHNAKFDLQKLELVGALPERKPVFQDTQIMAYLLNEHERRALKLLAKSKLGLTTNEEERLKKVRRAYGLKKEDGYYHLPREVVIPYAMRDTELTLLLYRYLKPQLDAAIERDPRMREVYEMELRTSETFRRMESHGFKIDREYLERMDEEYGVRAMKGLAEIRKLSGSDELNPNSPMQLKAAFEARGRSLDSTAEEVLRELDDPLARAILQYRSDTKIHKTYIRGLLNEAGDEDVVHPWFNTTGASTGRTSSSKAHS